MNNTIKTGVPGWKELDGSFHPYEKMTATELRHHWLRAVACEAKSQNEALKNLDKKRRCLSRIREIRTEIRATVEALAGVHSDTGALTAKLASLQEEYQAKKNTTAKRDKNRLHDSRAASTFHRQAEQMKEELKSRGEELEVGEGRYFLPHVRKKDRTLFLKLVKLAQDKPDMPQRLRDFLNSNAPLTY